MLRGALLVLLGSILVYQAIRYLSGTIFPNVEEKNETVEQTMSKLALKYFPPNVLSTGIQKHAFDRLIHHTTREDVGRLVTMVVQVIDGKIWVDRSRWKSNWAWDNMRSQFILEEIRILLRTDAGRALPNFEFILNLHDCPMRNYSDEGLTFSITRCKGKSWTVPLPQWFHWRDSSFGNWNNNMAKCKAIGMEVEWESKSDKLLFYGALRKSSLIERPDGELDFLNLSVENWDKFGRGKLWRLQQQFPNLFEVGISKSSSIPREKQVLEAMQWKSKPYMSMNEQARRYKFVVYIEGNCGWADRLKNLLAYGMTIFLQDTPCAEFFQPLLKPWIHYIPIRNDLSDLVEKARWAQRNPQKARAIGTNAAEFAQTYLTSEAWRIYFHAVLKTYAGLMRYEPRRRASTKRFKGSYVCPNHGNSKCNVDESYVDK